MSEEELNALIQEKEKELFSLISQMEILRLEFANETTDFATDWYQKNVKIYIMKFSEITLKMKEEKIHEMKTKVNELVRDADKIVSEELSNPELWWHQRPNLEESAYLYTQVSDKYPEILDRAVRHILGRLGVILEEFGYNVTTQANSGAYPECWFDKLPNGPKVPYFPHMLTWSKDMQYTIVKYNTLFTAALQLMKQTQELRDQKKELQASARWDTI